MIGRAVSRWGTIQTSAIASELVAVPPPPRVRGANGLVDRGRQLVGGRVPGRLSDRHDVRVLGVSIQPVLCVVGACAFGTGQERCHAAGADQCDPCRLAGTHGATRVHAEPIRHAGGAVDADSRAAGRQPPAVRPYYVARRRPGARSSSRRNRRSHTLVIRICDNMHLCNSACQAGQLGRTRR